MRPLFRLLALAVVLAPLTGCITAGATTDYSERSCNSTGRSMTAWAKLICPSFTADAVRKDMNRALYGEPEEGFEQIEAKSREVLEDNRTAREKLYDPVPPSAYQFKMRSKRWSVHTLP